MSVLINASTSTGLVQSADTSGEIELQSNGTTALKVNTNEGIQILNCLGVGNATPSTSGAGITFPATQSASSDANTLDDYEEGSWTPSFTFTSNGSASFSYTAQVGSYTKIGRQVTVFAFLSGTITKSNATGDLQITGLPFTPANLTYDFPTGSCFSNNFPNALPTGVLANFTNTRLYIAKNTSQATLGVGDLNASDTVNIRFSYTYIV